MLVRRPTVNRAARAVPSALVTLAALTLLLAGPAAAQEGPPPHVRAAVHAVEEMLGSQGDGALQTFAAERIAPAYRDAFKGDSLLRHLRALRAAVGEVGGVLIRRDDEGLLMQIEGPRPTAIRLVVDDAGKLTRLELVSQTGVAPERPASPWDGLTWETLDATIARAEQAGFHGVILARRDGREVARRTIGKTDPVSGQPITPNTVYCIGSTPIDFTITGIMLLGQRGKLALDDSITRFIVNVPEDKRGITIRHLLSGRSGLVDFFHDDNVDWDHDLAWIPRDEAVRRLMASRLRFAPGTSQGHSHGAFVLLAAIIEKVSGTTYQDFVRREILQPLGMTRTGFYGETLGLSLADFAVGSGPSVVGLPNIPPNWGPTSWLVMGSGGMVSTLEDMARYYDAIERGTLLTGEWASRQQGPNVAVGGSDRGFLLIHATDGNGSSALVLTNTPGPQRTHPPMIQAFERLVIGGTRR